MKLLLADDHALFRDALVQYIERAEPEAKILIARDFPEAMQIMEKHPHQDLVMLDLRMPGMDGMEGFRIMRAAHPNTPVALMSGVAEPEDVRAAMELGAIGYFPKTLSGKALLKAIQLVLTGERFLPLDQNNAVMPSYYGEPPGPDYHHSARAHKPEDAREKYSLTPRETDVLEFLVRGASNKEIANTLGLQIVTVKLHVRGICRKLGAKNRTQAALIATEGGLVR